MTDAMPVVILAGYEKNPVKARLWKRILHKRLRVKYIVGENKGLIGHDDLGYSILQSQIDEFIASPYVSEITVVGPIEEFNGKITGCKFIDYNKSVGENFGKAVEQYQGQRIGIATADLPYVTKKHIDDYFADVEGSFDVKDYVCQLVKKNKIKKVSWWKPSLFIIDKGRHRVCPGHFHIINTPGIPKWSYTLLNVLYDVKGLSLYKKYRVIKQKHAEELEYLTRWNVIKYFMTMSLGLVTRKSSERFAELLNISMHLSISDQPSFAMDVDTEKERDKALEFLHEKVASWENVGGLEDKLD